MAALSIKQNPYLRSSGLQAGLSDTNACITRFAQPSFLVPNKLKTRKPRFKLPINILPSVLSASLNTLTQYLSNVDNLLSDQTQSLKERMDLSRKATDAYDQVKALYNELDGSEDINTIALTSTVKSFIESNRIDVEGVYSTETGVWANKGECSLPELMDVKAALTNFSQQVSDIAAQKQLSLQKIMQSSSQIWLQMTTLQNLQTEMNKTLLQNIRLR